MPINLSKKQNFLINQDSDTEASENEMFITDPDMMFDRLPQPFRFINKIIQKIFNSACQIIDRNVATLFAESLKTPVQDVKCVSILENLGIIQCMCEISPESSYLIAGYNNGLAVIDVNAGVFFDKWESSEIDVISISYLIYCDNISFFTVMENSGSARLVAFYNDRLCNVKLFSGNKGGDKPFQVTSIVIDDGLGLAAISFDQFKENEQWLEVHRLNRDAWIKEIKSIGKSLPPDQQNLGNSSGTEESALVSDRNGVRSASTTVLLKVKFPDTLGSTPCTTLSQLYKQLDGTGLTLGMGFNHCLSGEYFDKIASLSYTNDSDLSDYMTIMSESHLMRVANVRFSKFSGSMIRENVNSEGSDKEPAVAFVWWSQSQHLLIYGLNRTNQKSTNDVFVKPDSMRSFSCPITACELSANNLFLAIGLLNGMFVLLDIVHGLTRTVKSISDSSIKSIFPLNFESQIIRPNRNKSYFSIVDVESRMFCLKFDCSLQPNDSSFLLVSDEFKADYIGRLSGLMDMVLMIFDNNTIVIRDMVSGMKIMNIHLPDNTTIISPWQPIFGFSSKSSHLCLQVTIADKSDENVNDTKPISLLYNLEIDTLDPDIQNEALNKVCKVPELTSYVNEKAIDILHDRYVHHESRQKCFQESWNNLEAILKTLS